MNKKEIWPRQGKLKKGLIILGIVILATTVIVLLEEKTKFKHTQRLPVIVALACAAVWFYQPVKKEKA